MAHSIRFSLKQLLMTCTAISGVLGLYLAIGVGAASALVLGLGAWLTIAGMRTKRRLPTRIGVPLMLAGGVGGFLAMVLWLVFGVGPIYLPKYYPANVRQMIAVAEADPWKTKVYRYDNGSGFFLEDVSRMTLSQLQVDRIASTFQLAEVESDSIDPWFSRRFPRHWSPPQTNDSKFYKGTFEMADYNAMYEAQSAHFYVWRVEDVN